MQQKGGLVVVDILVVAVALVIAAGISYFIYSGYAEIEQESAAKTEQAEPTANDAAVELSEYGDPRSDLDLITVSDGKSATFDVLIGKF